jgi:hypothetical protein
MLVAFLMAACSGSGTPTDSGTTGEQPRSDVRSSSAMRPLQHDRRAACVKVQRRVIARLGYPMQLAVDGVMRSLSGSSTDAASRVRFRAAWAAQVVGKACEVEPAELTSFVRVARRSSASPMDEDDLGRVMARYVDWARSTGRGEDARAQVDAWQRCRLLQESLTASYRVWWRSTERGRAWWIQLTFRNESGRTLDGSLYGMARATGLVGRDRTGPRNADGSRPVMWGGSSADTASVEPGVSSQRVGVGATDELHTSADGTLRVDDVEVVVYPQRRWWCSLPVPAED